MAEWLKATDCKSVLSRVRRFEPYSAHKKCEFFEIDWFDFFSRIFGIVAQGRASGYSQGREFNSITSCCSSGVEHFLGKEEVVSSILINSSVLKVAA